MAVIVRWTEYERGWGERPDGVTLHKDVATAEQYIRDYWARMPDRINGRAPDTYSSPGMPIPYDPAPELLDRLEREGSFWLRTDGW